ncbi:MAG TPA: hypothetical protein VJ867_14390 [Gemmatimonadaceae bacterium]|nr:hypothetical protein [Gemmatimonadaceae bacterium]
MTIVDEELDGYSRRFAARLFEKFPEWRDGASADPDHRGALRVAVTAPSGAQLQVRTYSAQITIDFGAHWHEHLGVWTSAEEQLVFDKALQRIDDLVNDRVVIVSRFVFGRHAWSRALPLAEVRRAFSGRRSVTSWSGITQPPLSGI